MVQQASLRMDSLALLRRCSRQGSAEQFNTTFTENTHSVSLSGGLYTNSSVTLSGRLYTTSSVSLAGGLYTTSSVSLSGRLYTNSSVTLSGGLYTTPRLQPAVGG